MDGVGARERLRGLLISTTMASFRNIPPLVTGDGIAPIVLPEHQHCKIHISPTQSNGFKENGQISPEDDAIPAVVCETQGKGADNNHFICQPHPRTVLSGTAGQGREGFACLSCFLLCFASTQP